MNHNLRQRSCPQRTKHCSVYAGSVSKICWTRQICPTIISNVRRQGKFSLDKMSDERKLTKIFWDWYVYLNVKNVLQKISFVSFNAKMSDYDGPMVHRKNVPPSSKTFLVHWCWYCWAVVLSGLVVILFMPGPGNPNEDIDFTVLCISFRSHS